MKKQINYWTDSCNEKFHAPELDEDLSADLVVVGGGYTGCAAALEAANLGIKVVLLEANVFGFGGSGEMLGWSTQVYGCRRIRLYKSLATAPVQSWLMVCQTHQN